MKRTHLLIRFLVALPLLAPAPGSAQIAMPLRAVVSAAQSSQGGGFLLAGSFGGPIVHDAAGGGILLVQGFWVPGLNHPSGVAEPDRARYRFALDQNSPNPFNPRTTISFTVPGGAGKVPTRLEVYDISGRLVRTLVDEPLPPGPQARGWDGRNAEGRRVASGVYLARLRSGNYTATKQLVLLK